MYSEWGTLCDDNFRDDEASVTCSQLGYLWKGSLTLANELNKYLLVISILDGYYMQEQLQKEKQHLVKEQAPFFFMDSTVQERSHLSQNVHTVNSILMAVSTQRMLV